MKWTFLSKIGFPLYDLFNCFLDTEIVKLCLQSTYYLNSSKCWSHKEKAKLHQENCTKVYEFIFQVDKKLNIVIVQVQVNVTNVYSDKWHAICLC